MLAGRAEEIGHTGRLTRTAAWQANAVHALHDHADLLLRSGQDPWVRWALDPDATTEVWVHEDIALIQRIGRRPGFWVAPLRGSPGLQDEGERVRSALVQLRDSGRLEATGAQSVSSPQEHAAIAHEVLDLGEGGDWEWLWTTEVPAVDRREEDLVVLDDAADAEELTAFTTAHNSRVWAEIGTGRMIRWVGLRDDAGELVAIGGAQPESSGVPHLAGILTAQHRRGERLGTVVSASLTRWSVQRYGVCTLGMFTDNNAARAVYSRLGYRTARAWHSRRLVTGD